MKSIDSSKANGINLEKLNDEQRMALFGQPTKKIKQLGVLKSNKEIDSSESPEGKKNIPDLMNYVQKKESLKQIGALNFFQKFIIDYNNPYKSVWDVMILLMIAENCCTSAY